METAKLILQIVYGMKKSKSISFEPTETEHFVVLHEDVYSAHRMPNGWQQMGSPTGNEQTMRVEIELPEHVHYGPYKMANLHRVGLFCDYSNDQNGNGKEVLTWCDAVRAERGKFEEAFKIAAKSIKLEIPQADGKHSIIVPAKIIRTDLF